MKYGTKEQKERFLPGLVSGNLIGAIAMTEPVNQFFFKSISELILKIF